MSCYIRHMAVGQSGRIVLEIDPALKRALHARLVGEGRHLKDWFLEQVAGYLNPRQQSLPLYDVPARLTEPTVLKVAEPTTATTYSKRRRR